MNYPILITKQPRSDFGVIVPDLPGCITTGRTMDEALEMAREAIELHLEGLVEHGQVPPLPRSIDTLRAMRRFAGGTWAVVQVDPAGLRVRVVRVVRVGVTMPQRLLDAIDRHARQSGETRSGLQEKRQQVREWRLATIGWLHNRQTHAHRAPGGNPGGCALTHVSDRIHSAGRPSGHARVLAVVHGAARPNQPAPHHATTQASGTRQPRRLQDDRPQPV